MPLSLFVLVVMVFIFFNKSAELPYFIVSSFMKIKAIALAVSDLEEIVIKCLFDDSDLSC
jgi:hypothetical protein